MSTLASNDARRDIVTRLEALQPDSTRRWGRMTAPQMVCHLTDAFRVAMGERTAASKSTVFYRTLIRWVALHTPLPWPKDVPTMPEVDQMAGGTPPGDFSQDVAQLRQLVDRFVAKPRPFAFAPHPLFGEMSDAEWMIWGYRHMDHHLRQFGV
jgi:hypothetical protein